MKITILRHGEVDMKWNRNYNSVEFDEECKNYDESPIKKINEKYILKNKYKEHKIYISGLLRTRETAEQLFGDDVFYRSELFNEIPLRSFIDTKIRLPLIIWNIIGRIQWLIGSKRQLETRLETIERARKAILSLEQEDIDCCIVTHGFFMRIFLKELTNRGFKIDKKKITINNLDEIIAYK